MQHINFERIILNTSNYSVICDILIESSTNTIAIHLRFTFIDAYILIRRHLLQSRGLRALHRDFESLEKVEINTMYSPFLNIIYINTWLMNLHGKEGYCRFLEEDV